MESYEISELRPFTGYGRPCAWAVLKDDRVFAYEYMGTYERVNADSETVAERQKRPKFAKLSKKEVSERINFELFMEHRHRTKGMLYDIAEKSGGELYSGIIRNERFIVKEK